MIVPATCSPGIAAGMAALQMFYNAGTGLWDSANWWNAANALEATIEYSRLTDSLTYRGNIFNTFYQKPRYANFINPWFRDDDGWWAIAWIRAYDLTGEKRYLDQAKLIFWDMTKGWDNVCGGGLYWHKRELNYKNAITNGLLLSVAAKLNLREPEDKRYLEWSQKIWKWYQQSGMINAENLVNDGLDYETCRNNGKTTWTYNQGVLIGGLVDLYRGTNDPKLLQQAEAIADASIVKLARNGILREPCEDNNDCGNDGPQFKGIFMRNLAELYRVSPKLSYREFITRNAESIWANRNQNGQFGLDWAGNVDQADAKRQTSAIDALNAAIALRTTWTGIQPKLSADTTKFNVSVACSGRYDLQFRYASPESAVRYLYVNGKSLVDRQLFPKTGALDQWQTVTVENVWLNAGDNAISVIFNSSKGSQNPLSVGALSIDVSRRLK
ncbi:glycoside hydrolase family 76 protein [Leptolyngbya sp. UWPOB_LEPTO1]|uniref:glycoside hydrolase family 76 protein n=1 Tax=Leptolyngbya sp. UWPOB_LEPTO1 TaxID=2815653 RepID=UPI00257E8958|nr:glycoside hydrolase family 76 protein [Leptolyngbya sp. UWPOB_LEPTO1]